MEVEKCEYCDEEPKDIFENRTKMSCKGDFYPGISVYIINNLLNIEAVSDVYEPGYEEAEIQIKYCPMCGRKLV